ncbi:MAG: hypothetical protein U9N11_07385, partial [Campylobacterota bacterium]|nr:hypothetical protein [Campylobacterota bacterium]
VIINKKEFIMYAIEFEAPIENGIVRIPQKYQEIQDNKKATFVVMYEYDKVTTKESIKDCKVDDSINDELDKLFANSNNKVQVTMELATNIDDMVIMVPLRD